MACADCIASMECLKAEALWVFLPPAAQGARERGKKAFKRMKAPFRAKLNGTRPRRRRISAMCRTSSRPSSERGETTNVEVAGREVLISKHPALIEARDSGELTMEHVEPFQIFDFLSPLECSAA